jgi:hypothetical protein
MSELKGEIFDLRIERKEKGLSEAKQLSIGQEIIALTNRAAALENRAAALTQKETALTNKEVEMMKVAQGIIHDHM